MPIIKWKQFKNQQPAPRDLNDFLEGEEEWIPFVPTFKMEEPALDISQDKANLYVEMPLAGINPENIEISITDNILTVQGKVEEKKETKDREYLRKEIRRGNFRRQIKLPVPVKEDKAKAESQTGILKIIIPKSAKSAPSSKKIPIRIK
jgi:HSP20 family protein